MRLRFAAVLLVGVALVGCSSGDDSTSAPAGAVAAGSGSGSGTALLDGFTVESGSELIGSPVPLQAAEGSTGSSGWRALLFLSGDPAMVVKEYLDQATEAGYTEVHHQSEGDAFPHDDVPASKARLTTCGLDDNGTYRCARAAKDESGKCFTVIAVRSATQSNLGISISPASTQSFDSCFPPLVPVDPNADVPAQPEKWPDLPDADDPLAAWPVIDQVKVRSASTVAAAPIQLEDGPCGPTAILQIDGDPQKAFKDYVDDLDSLDPPPAPKRRSNGEGSAGDLKLTRHEIQVLGGGNSYIAELVTSPEGAWIYLSGCVG